MRQLRNARTLTTDSVGMSDDADAMFHNADTLLNDTEALLKDADALLRHQIVGYLTVLHQLIG